MEQPTNLELNTDEQESLAIGEAAMQEQQQLLAGKFEDAEALENAYLELQRKLGQQRGPEPTEEEGVQSWDEAPTEEVTEEQFEVDTTEQWISEASAEWYENGELSADTLKQMEGMSSTDLVNAYIRMQEGSQSDITDAEARGIKEVVGGEEAYNTLMEWSYNNVPEQYLQSFNNTVNNGDAQSIELAVAGLQAIYERQNGSEGRLLSGGPPTSAPAGFRSQAEVVAAMSDPRYDRDPAYRDDVFNKLSQSNINF